MQAPATAPSNTFWRLIARHPRAVILISYLLTLVLLNAIPSRPRPQSTEENAAVAYGNATVRNWGWPMPLYSRYGGAGYISPLEILVSEATPVYAQVHTVGLILDVILLLGGAAVIWFARLGGLPGEGQEDVGIVRDLSDDEDVAPRL